MKLLYPKEFKDSIFKINLSKLKKLGIKNLIIDLDNTIVPRESYRLSKKIKKWINSTLRKKFKICLTSNSYSINRVRTIAKKLNLPVITFAMKPLPFSFYKALSILKAKIKNTAMIGDQLFMDIWGGNFIGMYTILVKPISKEKFWPRKFIRWMENQILSSLKP